MVEKANPSVRLKPATFHFRDDKRAAKEILFGKIEKSQILITQSINFIPKNAMNCILLKVSLKPLGNRKDKCGRRSLICEANFLTKKACRV